MSYDPIIVGARIKSARLHRDKTIKDLANYLKVSEATISRYENGIVNVIKLPILESICNYLDVSMDYITGVIDNPEWRELSEKDLMLEELHKNPKLRVLLSASSKLTEEDIDKVIKIAQMFEEE